MRIIYLISLGTQYVSLDALVKVWQKGAYAKTRGDGNDNLKKQQSIIHLHNKKLNSNHASHFLS